MKESWLEKNEVHQKALELLKLALWEPEKAKTSADELVFAELLEHNVSTLIQPIIKQINVPEESRKKWEKEIFRQQIVSETYRYAQDNLPLNVPYVILKGTSAA